MKIQKTLIIVCILVCLIGINSCCWVPIGSEVFKTEIVGTRENGDAIIAKEIHKYRFVPFSAEGMFYKDYLSYTDFYERIGSEEYKLPFLANTRYKYDLLKPVLPVKESNKWAVFRLKDVTRDKVDLYMHVFDRENFLKEFIIKDVIRVSVCEWEKIASYSIYQSKTDNVIYINTLSGLISYSQDSDELITHEKH